MSNRREWDEKLRITSSNRVENCPRAEIEMHNKNGFDIEKGKLFAICKVIDYLICHCFYLCVYVFNRTNILSLLNRTSHFNLNATYFHRRSIRFGDVIQIGAKYEKWTHNNSGKNEMSPQKRREREQKSTHDTRTTEIKSAI